MPWIGPRELLETRANRLAPPRAQGGSSGRLPPLFFVSNQLRANSQRFAPMELLLLWTLAGAMDASGECRLLVGTIAKRMHCSRRTAQRALQAVSSGPTPLVQIKHRPGCSVYQLCWDPAAFGAAREKAQRQAAAFDAAARERCAAAKTTTGENNGSPVQSELPVGGDGSGTGTVVDLKAALTAIPVELRPDRRKVRHGWRIEQ